jgi:DNA-binding NtrC family response regulator
VLGGSGEQRLSVAQAFHRAGPLGRGAFVAVDCARDEARLCRALQSWLVPESGPPGTPAELECGTLYLDPVGCLSARAQGLLLALACRMQGPPLESRSGPGPLRLAAGNDEDLDVAVEERRFSGALYDFLDKIRVALGQAPKRGVA